MAFFMDANEKGDRIFNVGAADADGKGGPLEYFSGHADRTRLRWVIDETALEVADLPAAVGKVVAGGAQVEYYNLQGLRLAGKPVSGLYLERSVATDGAAHTRKVLGK